MKLTLLSAPLLRAHSFGPLSMGHFEHHLNGLQPTAR